MRACGDGYVGVCTSMSCLVHCVVILHPVPTKTDQVNVAWCFSVLLLISDAILNDFTVKCLIKNLMTNIGRM